MDARGSKYLADAASLFVGLRETASLHQAIQVAAPKASALSEAKKDIRRAIRECARRIRTEDRYWRPEYASKSHNVRPEVIPKFFTQGSCAYKLLVDPCHRPPQQIDLDDGMYVPVDYLEGRPALAAKALFAFVEEALRPLCLRNGWSLDDSKETCVRVQISADSHVDIPIYSAPKHLAESTVFDSAEMARVAKRAGKFYNKLPSHLIMLAHRGGTWQQSDPLKLHDWVEACVERYGEDFRRACRYFKGWRDFTWKGCCLSSITIMAAVAQALEQMAGSHRPLADDKLVYEIARRLPEIFESEIENPAVEESIVLNDWDDDERELIVGSARDLGITMHEALKGTLDATLVVEKLRSAFGDRIPYRPDVVRIMPPLAAAVVAERAATVPSPRITRSTSG